MVRDYFTTSRELEYNDLLIYSKHINALTSLNSFQILNDESICESNDILELKDYLINILK